GPVRASFSYVCRETSFGQAAGLSWPLGDAPGSGAQSPTRCAPPCSAAWSRSQRANDIRVHTREYECLLVAPGERLVAPPTEPRSSQRSLRRPNHTLIELPFVLDEEKGRRSRSWAEPCGISSSSVCSI